MQLREIMTKNVKVVSPDAPIRDAAVMMRDDGVGSIPVCDGNQLKGMVTDRDIVIRAVASGDDPNSIMCSDVMTPGVVYCFDDQDVDEAARLMREKQLRRLIVLNHDKQLAGIVSIGDVSTETQNRQMSGEVLEDVSEDRSKRAAS